MRELTHSEAMKLLDDLAKSSPEPDVLRNYKPRKRISPLDRRPSILDQIHRNMMTLGE